MSSKPTDPRACVVRGCPRRTNLPTHTLCRPHFDAVKRGVIKECPNCQVICDPQPAQFCPQCGYKNSQIREQPSAYNGGSKGWNLRPEPETRAVPPNAVAAVELVRKNISNHESECKNHEANTVQFLVMPMLDGLGWNQNDPTQVIKEYKPSGRRRYGAAIAVDIALMDGGYPMVFIEAKRLDRKYDPDYMDQLAKYAAHLDDGKVAALTNGRFWLVCSVTNGKPQLRATIDIADGEAEAVAVELNSKVGRSIVGNDAGKPATSAAAVRQSPPSYEAIVDNLKLYREREAERRRVPRYAILKDDPISLIAEKRPTALRQLREIPGVGPATVEQHGDAIIAIVRGDWA